MVLDVDPDDSGKMVIDEDLVDKYNGKIFVFSGFRDKDLKENLESIGAIVKDSVTKKVDYVVVKDINSTSNKTLKADKYGIEIIERDQIELW